MKKYGLVLCGIMATHVALANHDTICLKTEEDALKFCPAPQTLSFRQVNAQLRNGPVWITGTSDNQVFKSQTKLQHPSDAGVTGRVSTAEFRQSDDCYGYKYSTTGVITCFYAYTDYRQIINNFALKII